MNIQTKYSVGDEVWIISKDSCAKVIACECCNDTKQVEIHGIKYHCPNCVGSHNNTRFSYRAVVRQKSIVGKVIVEFTGGRYTEDGNDELCIKYMISATGIGSGSLWEESSLFASRQDAQDFCAKFNAEQTANEKGR